MIATQPVPTIATYFSVAWSVVCHLSHSCTLLKPLYGLDVIWHVHLWIQWHIVSDSVPNAEGRGLTYLWYQLAAHSAIPCFIELVRFLFIVVVGLVMVSISCVLLALVLLGCLLGLVVIRWRRSRGTCSAHDDDDDQESKTDDADESRRIVSRENETSATESTCTYGWLRRLFSRATGRRAGNQCDRWPTALWVESWDETVTSKCNKFTKVQHVSKLFVDVSSCCLFRNDYDHDSDCLLSAAATPGGQSFRRRQHILRLSKHQQIT